MDFDMDVSSIFGIFCCVLLFCLLCRICCRKRTNEGMVITTPVTITSEVHRVATGAQAVPSGVVVQGHTTGTAVFPPMPAPYAQMPVAYPTMPGPYGPQHTYPAQPYPTVQQYMTQSGVPALPQGAQFPPLPSSLQHPGPGAPPSAMMPLPSGPPMVNPPSYDQAMTNSYAPQAPYNPDFKG